MTSKILVSDLNNQTLYENLPNIAYVSDDTSFYNWSPEARPFKEISRHVVAKTSGTGKKNLLEMPGTTGRDIQILKHYKVSAPNATWTLVERNFEYLQKFKDNAVRMGLFSSKESVVYQQSSFNRLEIDEPFDFAWFDLLGNLTYSDIFWLRDIFKIDTNGDIYFTFSFRGRSPADSLLNVLKKTLKDPTLLHNLNLSAIVEETPDLVRSNPSVARSEIMDRTILLHWTLFKYIFGWYNFNCHCYVYNDKDINSKHHLSEMLVYHLSGFSESQEAFAGIDAINTLLDIVDLWRATNSDAEIAQELRLEPKTITRWREINKLPSKDEVPLYQMSESFMTLLQDTAVEPPSLKNSTRLLERQLHIFNSLIETLPEVRVLKTEKGLQVTSPRGVYTLNIDSNFEISLKQEKRTITVDPLFAHPYNTDALHAVFRILFIGDEYLHPQLCRYLAPECLILSKPQELALQSWSFSVASQEKLGAIVLPTGMGKTLVASKIADIWSSCNETGQSSCRILFLAHQREILDQSAQSFLRNTDYQLVDLGVFYEPLNPTLKKYEKSRSLNEHLNAKVIFASIQSLTDEKILVSLPQNHFSLIIIDEFHHYKAPTWLPVITHFTGRHGARYLLGLSATPLRGDTQNPMDIFEKNYLYRMDMPRAIWNGYLTMPTWEIFDDKTNYRKAMQETGLSKAKLKSSYTKERIKAIFDIYVEKARSKKTIAFCNSKAHAHQMMESFQNPRLIGSTHAPINANVLTSDLSSLRRREILNLFSEGKIDILFVIGLFDEGVDVPDVEALLILRSTRSPVKMFQQLGRGLRLSPGKRDILILDFVGNYTTRNAVFNLAQFTQISSNKTYGASGQHLSEDTDDLPLIPQINVKYGKGVKFIIKNLTDRSLLELEAENKKKAIMLRKQRNLFAAEIANILKTSYGRVNFWLKKVPLKHNERALIKAIKELLEFGFSDADIRKSLAQFLEGYSYQELKKRINLG